MIGIFLLLNTIYFSQGPLSLLFPFFIATIISVSLWEFYRIAQVKGCQPLFKIGISFSLLYVFAAFISQKQPTLKALPEAVLGMTLLVSFLYYFIKGQDPFVNLAVTLFGIFYLTVPLTCALFITYYFPSGALQDGRYWILYLLAVTKVTDTGAYFCGKIFGSKKFAPYISPKKTWEGSIGGTISALLTSVILSKVFPLEISLLVSLGLGMAISVLAQIGDLSESLLKRDLGIKDSNKLPGIGGILDSVDSLVFTTPFVYLFLKFTHPVQ